MIDRTQVFGKGNLLAVKASHWHCCWSHGCECRDDSPGALPFRNHPQRLYINSQVWLYMYVHVCIYAYIYIKIHKNFISMCIYVYMHIYMHVYIYSSHHNLIFAFLWSCHITLFWISILLLFQSTKFT